jgi:2-iminobutanoate/2-iminopropanoate deaminase
MPARRSPREGGRRALSSATGAPAIGPYSAALEVGALVFLSGQIPLGADGVVVAGGIREQAVQVLENMRALLGEAGADFSKVAKTTVYLADMADFTTVNDVYATYFSEPFPARATVQVARLPRDVRVEIDAIVVLD